MIFTYRLQKITGVMAVAGCKKTNAKNKTNRHGGDMKRCVLASGPDDTAKLTRNGFVVICKDRRGQATAEKVRYGKFERREDYGQCKDCETGRLVVEGELFHAPKGVEFITIGEMMEKTENTGGLPETTVLKEIPGKNLKDITLSGLKEYWKIPLMKFGDKCACPNCKREATGHSAGLCSACYLVGKGVSGVELIKALDGKRKQFNEPGGGSENLTPPPDLKTGEDLTEGQQVAPPEADPPTPDNGSGFDYRKTQPYKLGQRYREIADVLMNGNTDICELAEAVDHLGLTINIEILS